MHIRRLAAFLLGAWLASSFLMVLVMIHNLSAAERMVSSPPKAAVRNVEILGATSARAFLRIHGLELNRWYVETWEWAQLGLGALLLASLIIGERRRRLALVMCSLMIFTVAVSRFAITPQATKLGRIVDLIPPNRPSPFREQFANFETASTVAETIKDILGLILLSSLLRQHGRSPAPETNKRTRWVRAS